MFCQNCGAEVGDNYEFCPECGTPLYKGEDDATTYEESARNDLTRDNQNNGYSNSTYSNSEVVDSGSAGWAILSFFIPIVGLILFLVWKDTKPKSAKSAAIGAIVSVALAILIRIMH